jgi:hypothetical protein
VSVESGMFAVMLCVYVCFTASCNQCFLSYSMHDASTNDILLPACINFMLYSMHIVCEVINNASPENQMLCAVVILLRVNFIVFILFFHYSLLHTDQRKERRKGSVRALHIYFVGRRHIQKSVTSMSCHYLGLTY